MRVLAENRGPDSEGVPIYGGVPVSAADAVGIKMPGQTKREDESGLINEWRLQLSPSRKSGAEIWAEGLRASAQTDFVGYRMAVMKSAAGGR